MSDIKSAFSISESMDDVLIRIEDLCTYFYTERGVVKAVDGVDILIRRGETLGLVGESGCGKSVTALSILRLIPQPPGRIVRGRVIFGGWDLLRLSEAEMRQIRGNRISMIFQEPMTSLDPVFRIGDQMAESIKSHQGLSKRKALDHSVEMLKKVGISDPERRIQEYPHRMSGGMRQRVMIAIALLFNPDMLIADEPTTALDVTIQKQILVLMDKLKQDFGASILLITHDLGVIAEMAQSVAVMYAGQIVEYADVVELFGKPKHPYTQGLMNSIPKMDTPVPKDKMLKAISGVVPSLLDLPEGCAFQDRCPRAFDLCRKKVPFLYDVGQYQLVRCLHYGRS